MSLITKLEHGEKKLYDGNFFSGNYKQELYLKKSVDDGSHKDKFYLELYSNINGIYVMQGYIYFYIDFTNKTSYFIGMRVIEDYRNLNIGSLLISSWIDFCLNNNLEYLAVHHKQKKPFIIHMLKKYGFDVPDLSLYKTRSDVISICQGLDEDDLNKYLLFKDKKHEQRFINTNIYKSDNYHIVEDEFCVYEIDKIILPLQDIKRNPVDYLLIDKSFAEVRSTKTIARHRK